LDSLQYELEAGNQSSKRKMKIKTMGIYWAKATATL
jgi:hypothetical protein